jgi:hypothetical protein
MDLCYEFFFQIIFMIFCFCLLTEVALCEKLFDISTLDLSMTYIIVFSIKVNQNYQSPVHSYQLHSLHRRLGALGS